MTHQYPKWVIPQVVRRLSFEEWGGTETVVWNSALYLKALGVKADIFATQALSNQNQEIRDGLTVQRYPYYYPYFNLSPEQIKKLDKKGGNPYVPALYQDLLKAEHLDLIHCHSMQRMASLVQRVAKQRQIPYILSFHGGHFQVPQAEIEDMCQAVKHRFHYGRILDKFWGYQDAIRGANGIICVGYNEYVATQQNYPDKSVLYLPNGVIPENYSKADGMSFRQRYHIPLNCQLLLNVGRIDPQKNQWALLDILTNLPSETHLLLIGPATNEDYLQRIQIRCRDQGLTNRVTIIPGLPPQHPDLIAAYHAANVFVMPSLHEPFGIVVLEAWACGLPVVVSDLGGLKTLVQHGKTGFKAQDQSQFVQAIRNILAYPELVIHLRTQAQAELYQNYTWSQISQRLLNFYAEVISLSPYRATRSPHHRSAVRKFSRQSLKKTARINV